jgi:hypothetical protein
MIVAIVLIVNTVNLDLPVVSQDEDSIPEPWIIEPSTLDSEVPRHNGTIVIWRDLINVSAVELHYAEDIENTTFEYSSNGINWELIDVSYEGMKEWENWTDIYGNPFDGFKVWSVAWNTSGIDEGLYYIRATMVNTAEQIGQDNITVYFDPTPPMLRFTVPWGVAFNSTAQVTVETNATDIVYTQLESLKVSVSDEHNVPQVSENAMCVWTSMAALLRFWANRPDKDNPTLPPPLHKLIEDDQGNEMTDDAQLIEALSNACGKPKNKGLSTTGIANCLKKWLNTKNLNEDWIKATKDVDIGPHTYNGIPFRNFKAEFENGPLIVLIRKKIEGKWVGHAMVATSVNNLPVGESPHEYDYIEDNNLYRVEFMDPNHDFRIITAMRGDGAIFRDWEYGKDGKMVPKGEPWIFDDKIQLLPDKETLEKLDMLAHWVPEDIDYDGNDGWSLVLDTTELDEGYHFIRVTMVDSSGNNGTQTTEVFVDNIPPIPGDHDVAITSITANAFFITVVVENQGRYNETAWVSVYYKRIDPTLRIELANGTSATLYFEWNPISSQYKITAQADQVLDELDTADNILTITTSLSGFGYGLSQFSQHQPNMHGCTR